MDITEVERNDAWVRCPFVDSHIMPTKSYYRHVVRCREKHPETRKIPCRFNAFEYLLPEHMDMHVQTHHAAERNLLFHVGFNQPLLTAAKRVVIDDEWEDEETTIEKEGIKRSFFHEGIPGTKLIESQYNGKNIEELLQSMNPQLSCGRNQVKN